MEQTIILSNIGSTSKKYSVYQDGKEIAWFNYEKVGEEFLCSYKILTGFEKKHATADIYANAIRDLVEMLQKSRALSSMSDIAAVGLRVVVPHPDFVKDLPCTPETYEKLKSLHDIDPLHIEPVLEEISLIREFFAEELPLYLVSDSAFHVTGARRVPLDFETPMQTIGYHGLSAESVVRTFLEKNIQAPKIISAHLGGGSSVSAIQNGQSRYNSMEVSPLSGVLMSSRSGSIDPFAVLFYMKEHNLSYEDALEHLYLKSGLKMLSGVSSDLRVIREEAFKGNKQAKDAIVQFVDSITSTICKAASYTQGIDALVFTGTIGLRAPYIREMVLEKLRWLGCVIDHYKNTETSDSCYEISAHDSKIKIYVVQIDEMREMHSHVTRLMSGRV